MEDSDVVPVVATSPEGERSIRSVKCATVTAFDTAGGIHPADRIASRRVNC